MLRSFTGQLGSASQSTNPFFPVDCFAEGFGNVTAFYLLENINKFIEAYLPIFIPVTIQQKLSECVGRRLSGQIRDSATL